MLPTIRRSMVATFGTFVLFLFAYAAFGRNEFGTGMLRFALAPMAIIALAMATTTVAATIWTIRLRVDAPQFAASSSGLGNGQTVWVMAFIAAMAISTVVTTGAFTIGLRARMMRAR